MSAELFTYIQGAAFYRAFHEASANLLPLGEGKTWLDIGCGPGILSRIAAARGYKVRAVDRSAAMIAAARRIAEAENALVEFDVSDLEQEVAECEAAGGRRYDVVSASSLLVVLPDPAGGLSQLQALAKPDGYVLAVEATPSMGFWKAASLVASGRLGARGHMLMAWSLGRSGRALPGELFVNNGYFQSETRLLNGMVAAYLLGGGS